MSPCYNLISSYYFWEILLVYLLITFWIIVQNVSISPSTFFLLSIFQNNNLPPHQFIPLISIFLNNSFSYHIFSFFSFIFLLVICQWQNFCIMFVIIFSWFKTVSGACLKTFHPYYSIYIHHNLIHFPILSLYFIYTISFFF